MLRFFNTKYTVLVVVSLLLLIPFIFRDNVSTWVKKYPVPEQPKEPPKERPSIIYKAPSEKTEPIKDNFPLAAKARSSADLPPVPSYNRPPNPHVPESTPLLIGFTRTWPLLQQTVVGYLAAGWPAEDIYVIDNSGTMNRNKLGLLTLQNPFYLDHRRLTEVFGVNVVTTPTLLSFAQLQNFYMHFALEKNWTYYFWGHMDVGVVGDDEWKDGNGVYKSLYLRAVDVLRESLSFKPGKWAIRFFAYDYLSLVNLEAYLDIGGWDTSIGYYMTDCDMHFRLRASGFHMSDPRIGHIKDVATSVDDLLLFYRHKPAEGTSGWGEEYERGSEGYQELKSKLFEMEHDKLTDKGGRNLWHLAQTGGDGESFHIPSEAFQDSFERAIEFGKETFRRKWKWPDCELKETGLKPGDAWHVEKIEMVPERSV